MTAKALRATIETARPLMAGATRALWSAPEPRERYVSYLRTMHAVLRATTTLLETAATRCGELAGDPVAAPLGDYLAAHAAQEQGHDAWVLEDLAASGADPRQALLQAPTPQVARMAGDQYYWILHYHPVCLLGYVAVLEGDPPPPTLAAALGARTGLPDVAFRTITSHAALDPTHRRELDMLLDALPLTAAQEAAITTSALHTMAAATAIFTDLARRPLPGRKERADAG